MSLNCLLPRLCSAKNHRTKLSDDRPFPEEDSQVFPIENMYDRIVIHTKYNLDNDLNTSKLSMKRPNDSVKSIYNRDLLGDADADVQGKF